MISENLHYTADGEGRVGFIANDEARVGRRPGVLLCHEGAGLGEHVRARARRLADIGYVAFALDLFGGPFESREQGIATIQSMVANPSGVRRHGVEALAVLAARPEVDPARTAAIGFCFGGWAALEMARGGAGFGAVVAFHGGLHTQAPAKPGGVRCPLLVCTGADDPHVPTAQREAFAAEMTAAGADWRINLYGGAQHGFTDPAIDRAKSPGSAHHALTDARSWRAMLDLFGEVFGSV
ncbi:MAG TPA: dienelactone hydrolase family protein [Caulobacteraceae bacterium]|nr:dienelactone hydrolase family protein [Caulobacteraceae bacterium]